MSDCTPPSTPDNVSNVPPPPMAPDVGGPVSYATSIKPLFRPKDRNNMISHFDLWAYDDVKKYAQPIYDQVSSGNMPCDGPWDQDQIDLFGTWMHDGMNP